MYCQWSQTQDKPNIMKTHLAINCYKAPGDVKEKLLFLVKIQDAVVSNNKKKKSRKRKPTINNQIWRSGYN